MPVNDEYTADRDRRRGRAPGWRGPERRIAAPAGGQLLERGDEPVEPVGNEPGADDVPSYGDWARHSSGTTSGARGHEGEDFSGEHSFGEAQAEEEREAAMGKGDRKKPAREVPPQSTGEKMGKGKTQKGPTGEGQIGNAQTADGGERDRKSQPPGQK